MESFEQCIHNIDEHTKQAIQQHTDMLAKTIFSTAQKSNKSANIFDNSFYNIFSDSKGMGLESTSAFNPHTVVEMRDEKAYQVIDSWDKVDGILPNRKVMSTYYVDVSINSNSLNDIFNVQQRINYNYMSMKSESLKIKKNLSCENNKKQYRCQNKTNQDYAQGNCCVSTQYIISGIHQCHLNRPDSTRCRNGLPQYHCTSCSQFTNTEYQQICL